jgi:hypothetical protein
MLAFVAAQERLGLEEQNHQGMNPFEKEFEIVVFQQGQERE